MTPPHTAALKRQVPHLFYSSGRNKRRSTRSYNIRSPLAIIMLTDDAPNASMASEMIEGDAILGYQEMHAGDHSDYIDDSSSFEDMISREPAAAKFATAENSLADESSIYAPSENSGFCTNITALRAREGLEVQDAPATPLRLPRVTLVPATPLPATLSTPPTHSPASVPRDRAAPQGNASLSEDMQEASVVGGILPPSGMAAIEGNVSLSETMQEASVVGGILLPSALAPRDTALGGNASVSEDMQEASVVGGILSPQENPARSSPGPSGSADTKGKARGQIVLVRTGSLETRSRKNSTQSNGSGIGGWSTPVVGASGARPIFDLGASERDLREQVKKLEAQAEKKDIEWKERLQLEKEAAEKKDTEWKERLQLEKEAAEKKDTEWKERLQSRKAAAERSLEKSELAAEEMKAELRARLRSEKAAAERNLEKQEVAAEKQEVAAERMINAMQASLDKQEKTMEAQRQMYELLQGLYQAAQAEIAALKASQV
ncbi:hypothetical protein EUX98_g4099 [Antrodiella citrinella]|uniref:Uncharacterized protein n=1 Tax=Antrodiella citrinella TaxID=2447956 RepID=A0A4S4MUV7_9APHY|nr:hypothetical protein EUX98_g4099 [Antrodiella citrinella]